MKSTGAYRYTKRKSQNTIVWEWVMVRRVSERSTDTLTRGARKHALKILSN